MKRKIIIGVIVAVALIIGILSVVLSSNLTSNQKTGYNSTGIVPPATVGHHYGIVLNESVSVTAHP